MKDITTEADNGMSEGNEESSNMSMRDQIAEVLEISMDEAKATANDHHRAAIMAAFTGKTP